jgi:hypothetical protein
MQPINKEEFGAIFGPAAMHAVGHVAANLSFAAVAISLTHTVKTLEPAFNVLLSKLFLGVGTPLPVVTTLIPIMVRAPCRIMPPEIICAAVSVLCRMALPSHYYSVQVGRIPALLVPKEACKREGPDLWLMHRIDPCTGCEHTRLAQAGVALASASDLTFNWTGFISAMVSNLTFGFRAVWSKK